MLLAVGCSGQLGFVVVLLALHGLLWTVVCVCGGPAAVGLVGRWDGDAIGLRYVIAEMERA